MYISSLDEIVHLPIFYLSPTKPLLILYSVNGIVKNELLMGMSFFSIDEVKEAMKVAIDLIKYVLLRQIMM